jgi:hypothetical protein
MGQGQHAITYEEALKLTEGAPDVHRVLARHPPKGEPGRKKNDTRASAILDRHSGNYRKPALSARLAQEHPAEYEGYLRGDYKSIRAAAEAAGLVKPGRTHYRRSNTSS